MKTRRTRSSFSGRVKSASAIVWISLRVPVKLVWISVRPMSLTIRSGRLSKRFAVL